MRKNHLLLLVAITCHEFAAASYECREELASAFHALKTFQILTCLVSLVKALHIYPLRSFLRQGRQSFSWVKFVISAYRHRDEIPLEWTQKNGEVAADVNRWVLSRDVSPERLDAYIQILRQQARETASARTRTNCKRAADILETVARTKRQFHQPTRRFDVA